MYVRNLRVNILACKDYKINTKTSKIVILLILFFIVFRPLGLFTLCSHATKFSSFGTWSFVLYINTEINNPQCANRVFEKHGGMLNFISGQSNKKLSVIELFPARGNQKNGSSNNFITYTCVGKNFDHVSNAKAH